MSRLQPLKTRPGGGTGRKAAPLAAPSLPRVTLGFRGTTALVTLAPETAVAAVAFDASPLAPQHWRVAPGGLEVECPPAAFDASPHVLRLDWAEPGLPALDLPFRSDYRGGIEQVDDSWLRGWVCDMLRPDSPLTLEVACGDARRWLHNTVERPYLADLLGGITRVGFALPLPPRAGALPEIITITIDGTVHQPFGPILRGVTLPSAIATAAAALRGLGRAPAARLFGAALLPDLLRGFADAPRGEALALSGTQFLTRPEAPEIDVVVPAYRGRAETLACLQSLLDGGNRVRHRIVVIDDCSPEPDLSQALERLAAERRIVLLRNETNRGFVASANRGMAHSRGADVLLLNADTLAPPGLLDRLYRAAYSDPAIATVTPLSNNATAYSLPAPPGDPADPWDLDPVQIDAICARENAGAVRDIPTAHGFCMFIKRAALDDLGPFDEATFGKGYGEENDFSLRALLRGWRNVCAADIYVHHAGVVSFGLSAERDAQLAANLRAVETRYPFYASAVADFLRSDPLHDLRNNVQKAVWRRYDRRCVFVTLALDGGAARHSTDMMARLAEEGWLVLALSQQGEGDGVKRLALHRPGTEESLRYPAGAPDEALLADILDLAPRFLHVQHMIDLPDGVAAFVRASGIPYAVTLHDFFYACPKVTLLDSGARYCGMPPAAKCAQCVRHGPIHPQVHPSLIAYAAQGETWRGKWEGLLREAAQVIAPSDDTATRYRTLFPGLSVTVRPHFAPRDLRPVAPAPRRAGGGLRIALPGAIGPQKGAQELVELARHCSRWHDDIRFVLVGYSDREEELRRHDNIDLRGGYRPADAVAALVDAECDAALLLNVFPETFSYALSECLLAGLTPVAYDFGAIGERLRALGIGVLVPPGAPPEQIIAALRSAAATRSDVARERLYGSYRRLMADYYAPSLAELAEVAPPPDLPCLLGLPHGLHDDGWCDGTVTLRLWSPHRLQRLALDFWVPADGQFQAVEIACNGRPLARRFLDDGAVQRCILPLPEDAGRRLDVALTFDFVFRLQPPDVRRCAAMLSAVRVSDGTGWLSVALPEGAAA